MTPLENSAPDVLVLGATGQIGAILRCFWPTGRALWQSRQPVAGADWVQIDLDDDAAVARVATGKRAILCLAGVTPNRAGQGGNFADNTKLALAAVAAGARSGAQVLVASSAAVYGGQSGVLDENRPLLPVSDYGRAKVEMETRIAALADATGVQVCALRIGNVAGVDAILGGWRPGFQLHQFADGSTPKRSYIGAQTLARVLLDLTRATQLPATLNIATPGAVEMAALLDAADLDWAACLAPDTAIAQVELAIDRLKRFTRLDDRDSLAATMVAQWRDMKSRQGG